MLAHRARGCQRERISRGTWIGHSYSTSKPAWKRSIPCRRATAPCRSSKPIAEVFCVNTLRKRCEPGRWSAPVEAVMQERSPDSGARAVGTDVQIIQQDRARPVGDETYEADYVPLVLRQGHVWPFLGRARQAHLSHSQAVLLDRLFQEGRRHDLAVGGPPALGVEGRDRPGVLCSGAPDAKAFMLKAE